MDNEVIRMVVCKNCGRKNPLLWTTEGPFCNIKCYKEWKEMKTKEKEAKYEGDKNER